MGFVHEKQIVEHPGKAFCRFIKFESESYKKVAYLEFIDQRVSQPKFSNPGLSLGFTGKLESLFKKLKNKLSCTFLHKNYDWKKDNISRLPGWNFLNFKNTGIKSYYPWLTEYEKHPKRKRSLKAPKHKNTVYKLLKIELDVNKKGLIFYEKLFSQKIKDKTILSCNTELLYKKARSNSYKRVVLACRDLDKFHKVAKKADKINYEGQPAALIKNPAKGWDIVVVER
ncbi:MAG: hypothetical protein KDD40_00500 [Bdellovibrionales bacterium]|nr:hypothetical protein [Bdellovibrionales bacterium]